MKRQVHKPLLWISNNCRFPSTAGFSLYRKPCGPYLMEWQKQLIKDIFHPSGEISKPGVMLYGCRKVSKSMMYSFIVFYMLCNPKLVGAQIPILTGRSEEQSEGVILKFLQEQIGMSRPDDFKVLKKVVTHNENLNTSYSVQTQSEGLFGKQATGAVFDEVSNMKDSGDAIEAITSSMTLVEGKPLTLYATNPPTEKQNFVIPMLKGFEKDKDFIVKKFCAPAKADPFDPQTWRCNPFIDAYFKRGKKFKNVFDAYSKRAEKAKQSKKSLQDFRRLYLGQACFGEHEFIPSERIKFIKPEWEDIFKRKDLRWCAGIDASVSFDLTALSICGWSQNTDELYSKSFLYLPNTFKRSPSQKKMLEGWNTEQHIRIQNKEVLDFNEVISDFFAFIEMSGVKPEKIVFDPAFSSHYWESFAPFKPEKIKMTGRNCAPGIAELERIGYAGGLKFLGDLNPAILWMFNNTLVGSTQRNYVTLTKTGKFDNIDVVDSLVLPLIYMTQNPLRKSLIFTGG